MPLLAVKTKQLEAIFYMIEKLEVWLDGAPLTKMLQGARRTDIFLLDSWRISAMWE